MSIHYGFHTPRDLFEKLKRDAARLEEITPDNLFNFMITAWALIDWIRHGPATTAPAVEADRRQLMRDPRIKICRDIANASKHFMLTYTPSVADVTHRPPANIGELVVGLSLLGDAQGTFLITADGLTYDVLALKMGVLTLYEGFFARHGL